MNVQRMSPLIFKDKLENNKYLFILGGGNDKLKEQYIPNKTPIPSICELLSVDKLFSIILRK
jgi:hypothetical protein